ncbi:zinc-ribbon domain-containing protein [Citrobacter portucalensis]|uniref:putative zinc ribbon protein n=1 Tax=Citrobacter portucalensis TaxID=1639133 RepID=UPI00351CDFFA
MLMMSCHLALNSKGAITGARSAVSQPGDSWTCLSCGCQLRLHSGNSDTPPWFEHDQRSANVSALMHCQYRQHRDGLPGERFRVMLYSVHEQDIRLVMQSWYCVWCGRHYRGDKHCAICNTGLYSVEETIWRENYTCPVESPGDRRSLPAVPGDW